MIVVSTDFIAGHSVVQTLGVVQGSSVRAKHVGRDVAAALKSLIGGELRGYTELLNESRQQAITRMIESATKAGANAILGVRFSANSVMQGASEMHCWGTAVIVEEES